MVENKSKESCYSNLLNVDDNYIYADEVLACVLLKKLYSASNIKVLREVVNILINRKAYADISNDLRGNYIEEYCLDHFRQGMRMYDKNQKYNSSSTIFEQYCSRILDEYCIITNNKRRVLKLIYNKYFRSINAINNGVCVSCTAYSQSEIIDSVKSKLSLLNTNQEDSMSSIYMRTITDIVSECETFEEAFSFVDKDFSNFMSATRVRAIKYDKVHNLLVNIHNNNNKTISQQFERNILLTKGLNNVGKYVSEIEREMGLDIKYVIDKHNKGYKIYAVPTNTVTDEKKHQLNKEWRGLYDKELLNASGIKGCVFVNSTGELGYNETFEGALEMCYKSLDYNEECWYINLCFKVFSIKSKIV